MTVAELIEKLQAIHGDRDLRSVGIEVTNGDETWVANIEDVVLDRDTAVIQPTETLSSEEEPW